MKLTPPNARFWIWENDGLIKLTLKPGQSLSWGQSCRHDEGWSSRFSTWEWDGEVLTEQSGTDGTDCDGRLSTDYDSFTTLEKLRGRPVHRVFDPGWPAPLITLTVPGVFYPEWTRGKQSQRDYSAEAMTTDVQTSAR